MLRKDKDDIKDCWKEHFSNLLNQPSTVDKAALEQIPQLQLHQQLADLPTLPEVKSAIKTMKSGKAAGSDGIPAEVFKHGGTTLIKKLLNLFILIWTTERLPDELCDALIVTIFKKGDRSLCGNYRGILLLSIAGKFLQEFYPQDCRMLRKKSYPSPNAVSDPGEVL